MAAIVIAGPSSRDVRGWRDGGDGARVRAVKRLEAERLRIQAELDACRTRRERNAITQFATPGGLALEIPHSACESARRRPTGSGYAVRGSPVSTSTSCC